MGFMKKMIPRWALLIVTTLMIPTGPAFAEDKNILFISGGPSHGRGEHEHIAGCHIMAKRINESVPGVRATVSVGWPEDEAAFENLAAIVTFQDGGDGHMFNDHLEFIDGLMKQGVGLMCMHYAVEVPVGPSADHMQEWIGGNYETDWSINPHWTADVAVTDEHPIGNGVGPFELLDEWYYNMRWRGNDGSNVTSILTAVPDDEARSGSTSWPRGPKDHIVEASGRRETLMWAVERDDGGRGVGFTGAHFHRSWQNDDYRKAVMNGIVWIAKEEVPEDGVNTETPSDEEMELYLEPEEEEEAKATDSFYHLPGFDVAKIYELDPAEGSLVTLALDDKGRLLASDQDGGLFRITLPNEGENVDAERLKVEIGGAQGLLYTHGSLYAVVNSGNKSGLYKLRDTSGDDQFDEVELLRRFRGNGEHGPHSIVASPAGDALYIIAGNNTRLPKPEESWPPRHWKEDVLLGNIYGREGDYKPDQPGGWICRTDLLGKTFELVAIGFRNPYDIAFNADGELFAYDSDNEWDMGTPWYRPTRVSHVTSGAEFGWREDAGKWPDYYIDSLGSVADLGYGSPTGIAFGYNLAFPGKYQRALFLCDWSYGKIYASHLEPDGASYSSETEVFLSGAPLPLTDVVMNPHDGAMYFITGGRGTTSSLYRVTYTGDEPTDAVSYENVTGVDARATLRKLALYHGPDAEGTVDRVWPYLAHEDRYVRYAARVAIEHQPVEDWNTRALAEEDDRSRVAALAALARVGAPSNQPAMVKVLTTIAWPSLDEQEQLDWLRTLTLTFSRLGAPGEAERRAALDYVDPLFPSTSAAVNRDLARLLVYLEAPQVVARVLDVMMSEPTSQEQVFYALMLRVLDEKHWTAAQHRQFFQWCTLTESQGSGEIYKGFLPAIKDVALDSVSRGRRKEIADALEVSAQTPQWATAADREFVQQWAMDDFLTDEKDGDGDARKGQQIFGEAMCFKCHVIKRKGGMTGPNLTTAGARFDRRSILESLFEPSKIISDQYSSSILTTKDGLTYTGRICDIKGGNVEIIPDLANPFAQIQIDADEVESIEPSRLSMMPTGLLDIFTRQEVLDLLAFLQAQRG
jgi:putative heme-binding domain-containing protein